MLDQDIVAYYQQRETTQRALARRTAHLRARAIHTELADSYARIVETASNYVHQEAALPDLIMVSTRPQVLIVEDEYLLADDLRFTVRESGADVVGPAGSLDMAKDLASSSRIDAAIVDLDLRGEKAYPLLDQLLGGSVPILLVTGQDWDSIPVTYQHLPFIQKPASDATLAKACAALHQ